VSPRAADRAPLWRYLAAIEAGDTRAVLGSLAEDATWTLAGTLPISGTWDGRSAVIDAFLAASMSLYEPGSVRVQVTRATREGRRLALRWTGHGRPVGGEGEEAFCSGVLIVRDGKIQSVGVMPAAISDCSARGRDAVRDRDP
jgi:uncharacterized protein